MVRVFDLAGALIGDAALVSAASANQTVNVTIWVVHGTVQRAGAPFSPGTVKAFDLTNGRQALLGSAVLGASGTYSIDYRLSAFRANGSTHDAPNLLVRVHGKDGLVLAEAPLVPGAGSNALVNIAMSERRVFGAVRNSLDLPVAGVAVEAFHVAWTTSGLSEVPLGIATSDPAGRYSISYAAPNVTTPASPCSPPAGQVNLIVYAKEGHLGSDAKLATNGVIFNAAPEQEANLTIDKVAASQDALYKKVDTCLSTCLGSGSAPSRDTLDQLNDRPEYLTFVAQATGWDEELIRDYVRAWIVADEINEKAQPAQSVTPEVVFALARAGLGRDTETLVALEPAKVFSAVVDAVHNGIVSASLEASLTPPEEGQAPLVAQWQDVLAGMMIYVPASSSEEPLWQEKILALVLGDDETAKKRRVAKEHYNHPDSLDDLLRVLATATTTDPSEPALDPDEIANLRFALELYDILGGDVAMVHCVYTNRQGRSLNHVRDLATISLQNGIFPVPPLPPQPAWGWIEYARHSVGPRGGDYPVDVPGPDPEDKAAVYARRLWELFGERFPGVRFASDLKATESPSPTRISSRLASGCSTIPRSTSTTRSSIASLRSCRRPRRLPRTGWSPS